MKPSPGFLSWQGWPCATQLQQLGRHNPLPSSVSGSAGASKMAPPPESFCHGKHSLMPSSIYGVKKWGTRACTAVLLKPVFSKPVSQLQQPESIQQAQPWHQHLAPEYRDLEQIRFSLLSLAQQSCGQHNPPLSTAQDTEGAGQALGDT